MIGSWETSKVSNHQPLPFQLKKESVMNIFQKSFSVSNVGAKGSIHVFISCTAAYFVQTSNTMLDFFVLKACSHRNESITEQTRNMILFRQKIHHFIKIW